jgi:hypothetical protein
VLARFHHIDAIPEDWRAWKVNVAGAGSLAATLNRDRDLAFLFRTLATLRTDIPLFDSVDALEWKGPTPAFDALGPLLNSAVTDKAAKR